MLCSCLFLPLLLRLLRCLAIAARGAGARLAEGCTSSSITRPASAWAGDCGGSRKRRWRYTNTSRLIAASGADKITNPSPPADAATTSRAINIAGCSLRLLPTIRGTSTWFSTCWITTYKTITAITAVTQFPPAPNAAIIAGIALRIGPTTGISSPTPAIIASSEVYGILKLNPG